MSNKFEVADVFVALGGDHGNTVPKHRVTAAEIAVLQAIHGYDAIIDINPLGTIETTQRAVRAHIRSRYGKAKDSDNRLIVESLFPGAAARVFERLDELQLDPSQFKKGKAPKTLIEKADGALAEDFGAEGEELALDNAPLTPREDTDEDLDELPGDDEPASAGALG